MLIAIPLQKTVKSQIESDKLQFEKQKWDRQLAMDDQKQQAETLANQQKLDAEWRLKQAELEFQKEEKEKDQQQAQLEKERERLATKKKDKVSVALACIGSSRTVDEIQQITQMMGL